MDPALTPHEATEIAGHLLAAKMFSLASCVMLFYDIVITFGDEVEKIWKQRFTGATVLWFMNRYLSPLGYIVVIVSFHDPNWSKSVCNRYVLYPEVLKIFTAAAIGVIFILRLYSIYGGSKFVLTTVSLLLLAVLAVKIWAFTDGTSVNLPPGLVGCILTGKSDANRRFVFTWVAELIFDSAIFIATFTRTLIIYRRHRHGAAIPLVKVMMRDGIIYFLVIFAANVVTVTLFLVLPADLKAVNASFSTLITSLMVSRLILNLRTQALRPSALESYTSSIYQQERFAKPRNILTSTIIGNLGEPVGSEWLDDEVEADFYKLKNRNAPKAAQPRNDRHARTIATAYELTETNHSGTSKDWSTLSHSYALPHHHTTSHAPSSVSVMAPEIRVEVTRAVTVEGPDGDVEVFTGYDEGEQLPSRASSSFAHGVPTPSESGHVEREFESRSDEERRSGAWQPPSCWKLEAGVDVSQLGKPRRSNSR